LFQRGAKRGVPEKNWGGGAGDRVRERQRDKRKPRVEGGKSSKTWRNFDKRDVSATPT